MWHIRHKNMLNICVNTMRNRRNICLIPEAHFVFVMWRHCSIPLYCVSIACFSPISHKEIPTLCFLKQLDQHHSLAAPIWYKCYLPVQYSPCITDHFLRLKWRLRANQVLELVDQSRTDIYPRSGECIAEIGEYNNQQHPHQYLPKFRACERVNVVLVIKGYSRVKHQIKLLYEIVHIENQI